LGVRAWDRERVLAHVDDLPSGHDRSMAQLIDVVIVLGVWVAVLMPAMVADNGIALVAGILLLVAATLFHEIVALTVWGCTLGKRIRGLRVADLATGRNPSLVQATLRGLLGGFGFGSWYGIWINRTHRPLYDRLAGTIVVYR